MGICESSKNQGGTLSNITNALGSNTNQQAQQQNNTGIVDTIKNAVGSGQTNQNSTGIVDTIKNAVGSGQTTTTTTNSKLDTVKKVGEFVVQNKDALGNLIK